MPATHAPIKPYEPAGEQGTAVLAVLMACTAGLLFSHTLVLHVRERRDQGYLAQHSRPYLWPTLLHAMALPPIVCLSSAVAVSAPAAAPYMLAVQLVYGAVALCACANLHGIAQGARLDTGRVRLPCCVCRGHARPSTAYAGAAQALLVVPVGAALAAVGGVALLGGLVASLVSQMAALCCAWSLPRLPRCMLLVTGACTVGTAALLVAMHEHLSAGALSANYSDESASPAKPWLPEAIVCAVGFAGTLLQALCLKPASVTELLAHAHPASQRIRVAGQDIGCWVLVKSVCIALYPLGIFRDTLASYRSARQREGQAGHGNGHGHGHGPEHGLHAPLGPAGHEPPFSISEADI